MSALVVVLVLAAPALGLVWLASRRGSVRVRDDFVRAGRDDRALTAAQAGLRGGGESAWMRHGGG